MVYVRRRIKPTIFTGYLNYGYVLNVIEKTMQDRILTPQQENFLYNYTNPKSETFGNAYKSALKAEYSEEYSQNLTGQLPLWLSEHISDHRLVDKALKNLENTLNDDENKPLKWDATKFTLSRLNKKKFSERQELTDGDGKPLSVNIVNYGNDTTTAPIQSETIPS